MEKKSRAVSRSKERDRPGRGAQPGNARQKFTTSIDGALLIRLKRYCVEQGIRPCEWIENRIRELP